MLKLHRNVKIIHKEQIVITYKLLAEHKQDPVLGEYKTYGIAVEQEDTVIRVIEDISPDREKVGRLIGLFNSEQIGRASCRERVYVLV